MREIIFNLLMLTGLFACCMIPLVCAAKGRRMTVKSKKAAVILNIVMCAVVCITVMTFTVAAAGAESADATTAEQTEQVGGMTTGAGIGLLGAGMVTGLACVGAGIAVSASASSAIGAISENPASFGKALIFVALAEGVAIYGMLISILIINKI